MNADNKVYEPEIIQETPYPSQELESVQISSSTPAGTYKSDVIKSKPPLTRKIAYELLGTALNTRSRKVLQSFELAQSGGFKIGNYQPGVSGEVSITPNGLVAKDDQGMLSLVLDALTGGAVFRGTVQTGAVVSGLFIVGDNSIVIDGESRRMVFYDDDGTPVIVIGNA